MKQFNHNITNILETVDIDDIGLDDTGTGSKTKNSTPSDRVFVAKVVDGFKKGEMKGDEAGILLRRIATQNTENKAMSVVADFVDVLNQSSKSSTINTSTLRKLAMALGLKDRVLDDLSSEEDRMLAMQLIQNATKMEA